jgi:hypothetical protein
MTSLGAISQDNFGFVELCMYGLSNVAGGAKTITATQAANGGAAGSGNSVSYINAHVVATPSTTFGTGASLSQSLTCSAGQLIVQAFSGGSTAIFSSISGGTARYNSGAATYSTPLLIEDSTASTTFAATNASSAWAGIGGVLS